MIKGEHWREFEVRRKFFIEMAKKENFDPLDASNWYSITKEQVLSHVRICVNERER